jgi:hypothetical protein
MIKGSFRRPDDRLNDGTLRSNLIQGPKYTHLEMDHFWVKYVTEALDEHGQFIGTVVFVPNIGVERAIKGGISE